MDERILHRVQWCIEYRLKHNTGLFDALCAYKAVFPQHTAFHAENAKKLYS